MNVLVTGWITQQWTSDFHIYSYLACCSVWALPRSPSGFSVDIHFSFNFNPYLYLNLDQPVLLFSLSLPPALMPHRLLSCSVAGAGGRPGEEKDYSGRSQWAEVYGWSLCSQLSMGHWRPSDFYCLSIE